MDTMNEEIRVTKPDGTAIILEYIQIGSGNPKTLLISAVHGNERTGQLIITELLRSLQSFSGTLTILPIANPSGYANNTREEAESGFDINRQFLDAGSPNVASSIASAIIGLAKQHDYVIDLHNFSTDGLIQAASNHVGQSDYLATLFKPEVIRISPEQVEVKTGTLARHLAGLSIPYILIEAPFHDTITDEQIQRIVAGILQHLEECSTYSDLETNGYDEIPHVVIRKVKSMSTGIFAKNAEILLGNTVQTGQPLGTIRSVIDSSTSIVHSPYTGIICEMNDGEREVVEGDTLLRIGETD